MEIRLGQTTRIEKGRKCTELQDNVIGKKLLDRHNFRQRQRKVVPAHAMKIYAGSRGMTPFILNLDTRWR